MEPWTQDEFVARLRAVGASRYHDRHPFNQRMHRGLLTPEQLRAWIVNRFYYQLQIPVKDALILARLPGREERRVWVRRLLYHDGTLGDEGGLEGWLQLGDAAGLSRRRMVGCADVLPGARSAVDRYVEFCRTRPWPEAVASSLTELFAPALMTDRIAAIERHYPWLDASGLRYFRERVTTAPLEAGEALELVVRASTTREAQQQAVAALEFKCDVLWALLDAVDGAHPDGPAPAPRLSAGAMIRHDAVRGADLVLLPERVITLNRSASAIIRRCDGSRTAGDIAHELERTHGRAGLEPAVRRLLRRLAEQGAITW